MTQTFASRLRALLAPNTQRRMSHAGAAVIRVAVGLFLATLHGWHKVVEGVAYLQRGTAWPLLEDVHVLGMPFPVAGAFAATFTQLLGGLAVAAGFLTRFAALAVAASLFVAAYSNFQMAKDNQLALLYALIFFGFALYGGGRYSADAWLFGRRSA